MLLRRLSLFLLCCALSGCVHRRVTILSDPPGALVRVDGRVIGYTPASFDFTWYGEREIQVLKDGYETQTQLVKLSAPWYQWFPFEFLSDNFAGKHIEDRRQVMIRMPPRRQASPERVTQRADAMRLDATHGSGAFP